MATSDRVPSRLHGAACDHMSAKRVIVRRHRTSLNVELTLNPAELYVVRHCPFRLQSAAATWLQY